MRRWIVIMTAVAVAAAGLGVLFLRQRTTEGTATTATAQSLADTFAQAGIAVVPEAAIGSAPDAAWSVLDSELPVLQAEIDRGQGWLGADLDTASYADVTLGEIPPSFLLAAWLQTGATPTAREAVLLMPSGWVEAEPPELIIPDAVLTLFLADLATLLSTDLTDGPIASTASVTSAPPTGLRGSARALAPIDPCADLDAFLAGVLKGFFERLKVKEDFLGTSWAAAAAGKVLSTIINRAIDLVSSIFSNAVEVTLQQVIGPIQQVLMVVATVKTILNKLKPLTVAVDRDTELTRFGIDGGPPVRGHFYARVVPEPFDPLPVRCRGVGAPEVGNGAGSRVHWSVAPTYLLNLDQTTTVLNSSAYSPVGYVTGTETAEQAAEGAPLYPVVRARIRVEHSLKKDLADWARSQFQALRPKIFGLESVIDAAYDAYVSPLVLDALSQLDGGLFDSHGEGSIVVLHHGAAPEKKKPKKDAAPVRKPTPGGGSPKPGGPSGGGPSTPPDNGGSGSDPGSGGGAGGGSPLPDRTGEGCVGCSSSLGDPRIITADGAAFDFQGAGEFTAALAADGGLELQVRQQPLLGDQPVAITSGAALRLGEVTVAAVITDGTVSVHLDGTPVELPDGERQDLPGGGWWVRDGASVGVLGPDGDRLVLQAGPKGDRFNVEFQPAADRIGAIDGLFGRWNDDPADDLVRRDGSVATSADFATVHRDVGESWRVTAETSLLPYGPGESVDTFADPSFPPFPMDSGRLGDDQRAAALASCTAAGVTDPFLLEACIVDTALLQEDLGPIYVDPRPGGAPRAAPVVTDTVLGRPVSFGDTVTATFVGDDAADHVVHLSATGGQTLALAPTAVCDPGSDGTFVLVERVANGEVTWSSWIGRVCSAGRLTLPTDGTYRIVVEPFLTDLDRWTFGYRPVLAPAPADDPAPVQRATLGDTGTVRVAPGAVELIELEVPAGLFDLGEACTPISGSLVVEIWQFDRMASATSDCRRVEVLGPGTAQLRVHNLGSVERSLTFTVSPWS